MRGKKSFGSRVFWGAERVSFREIVGIREVPPSPHPLKSLDWRGVCKNAPQNPEPVRVRDHNLENNELLAFFAGASDTAFAIAMLCFLFFVRKDGCHIGVVEKFGGSEAGSVQGEILRPAKKSAGSQDDALGSSWLRRTRLLVEIP
jgi:hypothetical protein